MMMNRLLLLHNFLRERKISINLSFQGSLDGYEFRHHGSANMRKVEMRFK